MCEEELDFELAIKRPDVRANQISTINWIDVATTKMQASQDIKNILRGEG